MVPPWPFFFFLGFVNCGFQASNSFHRAGWHSVKDCMAPTLLLTVTHLNLNGISAAPRSLCVAKCGASEPRNAPVSQAISLTFFL